MPRYVDEDVIRNKPVSKEYRDNWDRVFGDPEPERFVEIKHFCKECDALVPDPENHRHDASTTEQTAACNGYYDDGIMPTACENREGCGRTGCPAADFGYTHTASSCTCPHQDADEPCHDLDCPVYRKRRI